MEILSHSAIILSINSLKNELKQIEAKILNKKIALNQIKKNTFEILPLDAQHVINKSFSKEFSKLEKKKEKIVAALTQLKHLANRSYRPVEKKDESDLIDFSDMKEGNVYEIVSHSDEHLHKNAWVGCRIGVDGELFQFLNRSKAGSPSICSIGRQFHIKNFILYEIKVKKVLT